ncbi:MAG: tetratricopeptide repeat protein [Thermoanaerobaculia bacterium]
MRIQKSVAVVAVFLTGAAAGAFAAKKVTVDTSLFTGKSPKEAAAALITSAETLAGTGSFENIAVGHVLYLAGQKSEAKTIFERVLAGKHGAGDLIRIARVYAEAGEWAAAKPYFDQVVEQAPKDEDWLAEIGVAYYKAGDRAHAEELFARSLAEDPSSLSNYLRMASAYLGVAAP